MSEGANETVDEIEAYMQGRRIATGDTISEAFLNGILRRLESLEREVRAMKDAR